jgi:hypothetical protein
VAKRQVARDVAIERLEAFIGDWTVEAQFPGGSPTGPRGRSVFKRTLDGRFLAQSTEAPDSEAPDSLAIIGFDPARDAYAFHYFDSRGVARVYAMHFSDGLWTLLRDAPDFSSLDFSQRFTGKFSDDGNTIRGRWERSVDGSSWEVDFDLTYRKATGLSR